MPYRHKDGAPHSKEDCPIVGAILRNQRTHLEDEVFWRADGSSCPMPRRTSSSRTAMSH